MSANVVTLMKLSEQAASMMHDDRFEKRMSNAKVAEKWGMPIEDVRKIIAEERSRRDAEKKKLEIAMMAETEEKPKKTQTRYQLRQNYSPDRANKLTEAFCRNMGKDFGLKPYPALGG
jgi:hypothetical protein